MRDDAGRWDERYRGRVTPDPAMPKGLGGVELHRGRCLDVACGLGAQSLWAADNGYHVTALDASPVAITALNRAAISHGVRDRIETHVADLDDGLPGHLAGEFALVICQRYRDPVLYEQLAYMLAPGGVLIITVLSEVGHDDIAGPHHARPGELVCGFRELELDIMRSVELDGEATLVARRPEG